MMSAPASARARAIARPIPRVPPVTRAVLPVRSNSEDIVVCELLRKKERPRGMVPRAVREMHPRGAQLMRGSPHMEQQWRYFGPGHPAA